MIAEKEPIAPQFVRPKTIAEQLSIDIQTVYRAVYSGELPATRFSKKTILIRREDADAWIASKSEPIVTEAR